VGILFLFIPFPGIPMRSLPMVEMTKEGRVEMTKEEYAG